MAQDIVSSSSSPSTPQLQPLLTLSPPAQLKLDEDPGSPDPRLVGLHDTDWYQAERNIRDYNKLVHDYYLLEIKFNNAKKTIEYLSSENQKSSG